MQQSETICIEIYTNGAEELICLNNQNIVTFCHVT